MIVPYSSILNDQAFSMFNGRLDNDAVRVNPGDLVRMYFVNVGPGVSSAHVIGTIFDRVYDGKAPVFDVQTYAIPAGSGAMHARCGPPSAQMGGCRRRSPSDGTS